MCSILGFEKDSNYSFGKNNHQTKQLTSRAHNDGTLGLNIELVSRIKHSHRCYIYRFKRII